MPDRSAAELLALLRKLVHDEGCPSATVTGRGLCCAFCDGPDTGNLGEPAFRHAADCIWLELEAAASRTK